MVPVVLTWLELPSIYGSPHLLGAFGLGVLAAALFYNEKVTANAGTWGVLLRASGGIALVLFLLALYYFPSIRLVEETWWITDYLVAICCAVFVLLTAMAVTHKESSAELKFVSTHILEARPLVLLGAFSYSLYLTHLVVFQILIIISNLEPVKRVVTIPMESMPVRVMLVMPLLLFAYGFYLLFEKPFMRRRGETSGVRVSGDKSELERSELDEVERLTA